MTYMKNIDSIPDPKKKASDKDVVDPERFKKALKVEKGDDVDKREKRNRPKKQEEVEDEVDDPGVIINVPDGLFKDYMKDEESGPSILDAEGGTIASLTSDQSAPKSTKGANYVPDSDVQTANIQISAPPETPDLASSLESDDETLGVEPTPSAPEDSFNQSSDQPKSAQTPMFQNDDDDSQLEKAPSSKERSTTKEPEKTKDKPKASEKKKKLDKKTKTTKKTKTDKIGKTPESKETNKLKQEKPQKGKSPSTGKDTPESLAHSKESLKGKTEQEISKEKEIDKPDDSKITPLEGMRDKQDTKDKDSDKSHEDTIAPTSIPPLATSDHVEALQMSSFANMPKDVFELFEKMVGMMSMQKDEGKSTITLTLNMKNSVFDKSELILEHYDTAPHAYNVQFLGNPESVARFAASMQGLNNAIAESKFTFSINLLPPKLSKNYSQAIESTDTDMENQEKKDGEEKEN